MTEPGFLAALTLDAGLGIGLFLLGWLLASRIDRGGSGLQAAALATPIGAGLLAATLFLLSLLGAALTLGLTLAVLGLGVAALGVERLWLRPRDFAPAAPLADPTEAGRQRAYLLPMILILLLWAASLAVSIGRSYSTWDAAAIWGVKGYGVAREGTVRAAEEWGAYGLSYPLNVPLQISLFAQLDGDIVPGSKLLFPLYYGSLAVGLLEYWRRGAQRTAAGWGTVVIMTIPVVFDHATQGYANLPFATYLVLGTLMTVQASSSGRKGLSILAGLCFALAIWTRPEGLPVVGLAYAALLLAAERSLWPRGQRWIWILPGLLVGGAWFAFVVANQASGTPPDMLSNARASIHGGDLGLTALYWIVRYLLRDVLNPAVWGLFLPTVAIGSFLQWRRPRVRQWTGDRMILAAAVATAALVFVFYYLISFSGNLEWWLDTGLSRLLLPSALLLAVWAVSPWVVSLGREAVCAEDRRALPFDRHAAKGAKSSR